MHGNQPRVIPGNAVAVDAEKPFHALNRYGAAFLSKFEAAELPAPLLQYISYKSIQPSSDTIVRLPMRLAVCIDLLTLLVYCRARSRESAAATTS